MTLHARSVVTAAGVSEEIFDEVLDRVIQSGDVKIWKAQEIANELQRNELRTSGLDKQTRPNESAMGIGYGKVVLLGEHSVVYGRHAIAVPIPITVRALIEDREEGIVLMIPRWGVEYELAGNVTERRSFERPAGVILDKLGLSNRGMCIEVFPDVPRSMGLGGSAAIAVAIVRALDRHYQIGLSDEDVNRLAYESEKIAHGSPSGLDNTLACYAKPLVFRPGDPPLVELLNIRKPIPAVIGITGHEGLTAKTVGRVREAWQQDKKLYERIFDEIDTLVLSAVKAIQDEDIKALGELMNVNHGMLNALQVSTPELEQLVEIARKNGALGAKLTGGGGGGSIIAVCDGATEPVISAIKDAGFQAISVNLGATLDGS